MEIKVVEDKQEGLTVEFEGVDRGLAELIKERLLEDKSIEFAAVVKEHPLVGNPKLIVKGGKNAKKIVENTVKEIEEEVKEFASKAKKSK